MSSAVKMIGVDWGGAEGAGMADRADEGKVERRSGYWHTRPMRAQLEHSGRFSWHLTFLLLQLRQPRRDFVWPFLGIGLRRVLASGSEPDAVGVDVGDVDPEAVVGGGRPGWVGAGVPAWASRSALSSTSMATPPSWVLLLAGKRSHLRAETLSLALQ